MRFIEKLQTLDACDPAIRWVGHRGLRRAWSECDNGEWMIWLACECQKELGITDRQLHEIGCDVAERALRFIPAGEDRPRIAIMTKRRWLAGEATDDELAAARAAARAARDAARAAARAAANAAAWDAARAATNAAARDANSAATNAAAWAANSAAARDAARAANSAAAWAAECKAQADIVRKHIPTVPRILKTNSTPATAGGI